MIYGILLIALALVSIILFVIIAAQPTGQDDTPAQVRYTQAGKVTDGQLWKR